MSLVKVASLPALQEQSMQRVRVNDTDVLLLWVNGTVYAVSDTCTHARVSLADGWLEGDILCCPRHGGKFDLKTGKAVAFPAIRSLPKYLVHVDGEDVYVDVE
ncbi:Rieske (2Fe-2S) protein [Sulfoacidibacillus thermotolerans]|uniref:Rieske domain-containing protein n=1 Tax=Sulfoacidibacillus thermotolerans TaxID=1765684 RepID=A0A2U3DAN6_SULT2|nr:non-heme iron oxygenase ferredoxin subunit [Sulfoacidibacillus thermotolerans]PWI58346.1 hypothetical protein BM613_03770 [Sulfoacidibacillus thermotolerans]